MLQNIKYLTVEPIPLSHGSKYLLEDPVFSCGVASLPLGASPGAVFNSAPRMDIGMLTRYGGHRGKKIPGADQN